MVEKCSIYLSRRVFVLFLFCFERDFMLSLSYENQADVSEVYNSTSRYLDDSLYIDYEYFGQIVDTI